MSHTLFLLAAALAPQGSGAVPDPNDPLPSLAAVQVVPGAGTLPELTRRLVELEVAGTLPATAYFPVASTTSDTLRSIRGTTSAAVIKWLDSLDGTNTPATLRFGANCDYVTFFGDGWNADWNGDVVGSAPQFGGSGNAGWIWVNHEYISNSSPSLTSAPNGQFLTLAKFLRDLGVLTNDVTSSVWSQADVNAMDQEYKRQLGGSWVRIVKNAQSGQWEVDTTATNRRYDATGNTKVRVTGLPIGPTSDFRDHGQDGEDHAPSVVSGIMGDCSGGTTPWGTIITAEENVQDYYGDFEPTWSSGQRFNLGNGFDPGSNVNPVFEPSRSGDFGRMTNVKDRHTRDLFGYVVEIDPGVAADHAYVGLSAGGDGVGHRKLGAMGRARWENATFVTGADWKLVDGKPVVIYAAQDRRSGRIWKFVTSGVYTTGMTKAQVRDLLDSGDLYVSHFADLNNADGQTLASNGQLPTEANPGNGRWIRFSVNSTDTPPNAAALGQPNITVGEALRDREYNGIGGFPNDTIAKKALFTAAMKLGVMELNRPEDLEWNPLDPSGTPRLYVAFTNHTAQVALDQNGVLFPPAQHGASSPNRGDSLGSIMAIEEADPANPGSSTTFTFRTVWRATAGQGLYDAANPDNIMIDSTGDVWFGTDGNFGRNGTADAVYYLDLNPAHQAGQPGVVNATFGKPFRVAAMPSDAEATGPAFSADEKTLFISVQHPGENFVSNPSTWPQQR
ncbi:MAG: DUF839 domain-containing protein [Planctomycetota bacterium]